MDSSPLNRGSQAQQKMAASSHLALPRRRMAAILVLLGVFAALARLPLIRDPVDVSPDGCEYLGIARHLVTEGRWTSSLKWNFFTDAPVVHPALADRPPLYPLWAAGWVALSADPRQQIWLARLGNLLLAAFVPATLFWALAPAVSELAAGLAAFIFMLYPAFLRNSAEPLTEPLFLLLMFGSLGRFLRAASPLDWFAAGLLAGLSFLTRPTGVLLPVLYTAVLLIQTQDARRQAPDGRHGQFKGTGVRTPLPHLAPGAWRLAPGIWQRPLFLMLSGFILPLVPYWIGVTAQTGSPFTSILRYNYSIRHIDEGTFNGFERSFEPPAIFMWHHAGEVSGLIAGQWATMGWALGRSLQYLLPLGLFWRRGAGGKQAVLLGFALENFFLHALSWTVWGAARYLFPSYIMGMALLLDMPVRWAAGRQRAEGWRSLLQVGHRGDRLTQSNNRTRSNVHRLLAPGAIALAAALTLSACLQQDARLYREKSRPFEGVRLGWAYAAAGRLLAGSPAGSICAANQPWIVNLLTRQPAVMAPWFRDAAQFRRYLACYRPTTLTLFVTEPERKTEPKPEDGAIASRLVNNLWAQPSLRPEWAGTLELKTAMLHAGRPPRQALLIFRVRPTTVSRG